MVTTMHCSYCQKEIQNPFIEGDQPYCTKQCFYEHMDHLSDLHSLQEFLEDGPKSIHPNKLKGMIREGLISRSRKTKKFSLTDKSQKILEMTLQGVR